MLEFTIHVDVQCRDPIRSDLSRRCFVFPQVESFLRQASPRSRKKDTWVLWSKVLVACVPAAIIDLLLDDWLDAHFL